MILPLLALFLAQPPGTLPAPPVECTDALFSALDFWLGDWDLFTVNGAPVARGHAVKSIGTCAVDETFSDSGGKPSRLRPASTTIWTSRDGMWRRSMTDSKGRVAILTGKVANNVLTLTQTFGRERLRLRLARQPDGSLRETTEVSEDFGKTFASGGPATDFVWRRRGAP